MDQSPFEALTVAQLVKKFSDFYGKYMFITVLTTARHRSLSWARWIQFMPCNPVSVRSILTWSSSLHLHFPSVSPSGFPIKILYTFLASPMHATRRATLQLLFGILIWWIFNATQRGVIFLFSITWLIYNQPEKHKNLKTTTSSLHLSVLLSSHPSIHPLNPPIYQLFHPWNYPIFSQHPCQFLDKAEQLYAFPSQYRL
jgi:hypothetical protein